MFNGYDIQDSKHTHMQNSSESKQESELFTGYSSKDNHSSGPVIIREGGGGGASP